MDYLKLLLQFVVSGGVVVGATLLARHVDAKWAGLLVALPIMTILGYIFIQSSNSSADTTKYLQSALIFMVPAAVYIGSVLILHSKIGAFAALLLAIIPFAICAFIANKFCLIIN